MAETTKLRDPWLVAVWPGMGNVAVGAGGYLVEQLGARAVHELPAGDLFDLQHIEVKQGIAGPGRLPRCMVFEWTDPGERHDLLIFVGEAQPASGGGALCRRLLDYAAGRGVTRLFTFAAMATQLQPTTTPRVFGVATEPDMLRELEDEGVEVLTDGQISGLNGVLLAVGADRGVTGVCLLGELPFFAVGVPNPGASRAALDVFARLAGIHLDLTALGEQAEAVNQHLLELVERMRTAAREESAADDEEFPVTEVASGTDDNDGPALDEATSRHIEALFDAAGKDRTRAFRLKEELDRLGAFDRYEDRFLDLFRKGE